VSVSRSIVKRRDVWYKENRVRGVTVGESGWTQVREGELDFQQVWQMFAEACEQIAATDIKPLAA